MTGGTGAKLASTVVIVAGIASLIATLASAVSIWLQIKNYRKPLLQRHVGRLLLMVPIYSIASWISMMSLTASAWFDPIRDMYEAFTIYTFFHLLINYMGGERALIIMVHGREPVDHLWPMNYILAPVDISDPYTFLAVKRGILQYAWLKPVLALATVIMRATNTYQEGYVSLHSGYFWSGIIYNISVTVSLYSLGLFWVCMNKDLQPFRPMPKFLCIKLVIFASYWQGFFLSILVWLGAIPDDVEGYTPDNLAAAIQDALICLEMPAFAFAHLYAFSWKDYIDRRCRQGRMPMYFALRDTFGVVDLWQDTKETFTGDKYKYRSFDPGDKVMAHEDSRQRLGRLEEGMRYKRGGKAKYWIPKPSELANAATPLLGSSSVDDQIHYYSDEPEEPELDEEEDALYEDARTLEFGDWNYPVVAVDPPADDVPQNRADAHREPSASLAVPHEEVVRAISHGRGEGTVRKKKQKQKQKATESQEATEPNNTDTSNGSGNSAPTAHDAELSSETAKPSSPDKTSKALVEAEEPPRWKPDSARNDDSSDEDRDAADDLSKIWGH